MSAIEDCLYDDESRSKLFLELQRAIVKKFEQGDWVDFGYASGQSSYINHHARLLRSMQYGDEDYGVSVFQVLEHMASYKPEALDLLIKHDKIHRELKRSAPEVLTMLGMDVEYVTTKPVPRLSSGETVQRALNDAEHLIRSSGPVSAVDRTHTALHGYMASLCEEEGIAVADDASLTTLFKALRNTHPRLRFDGRHGEQVAKILMTQAATIDAVNYFRNNASPAHPNEELLEEAEATLAVNATRTIFNYILAKVGH